MDQHDPAKTRFLAIQAMRLSGADLSNRGLDSFLFTVRVDDPRALERPADCSGISFDLAGLANKHRHRKAGSICVTRRFKNRTAHGTHEGNRTRGCAGCQR